MGPRSDNRGYSLSVTSKVTMGWASMGPRSDNRGYYADGSRAPRPRWLQWVHGRITVVTRNFLAAARIGQGLQWVHGRITVVTRNRCPVRDAIRGLQWVHGRITVVTQRRAA